MCPFGTSLLVGMASGGIRRLQIGRENVQTQKPKLVEVSGMRSSVGLSGSGGCRMAQPQGRMPHVVQPAGIAWSSKCAGH